MMAFLVPFEQVGGVFLNDTIKKYLRTYEFNIHDFSNEEVAPSINYEMYNPEMILFVNKDNNLIEFIGCYEELFYKGVNLIGMNLTSFIDLVESRYLESDKAILDEGDQNIYEFENIGLQVWTRSNDDIIVSILVNSREHYLDE